MWLRPRSPDVESNKELELVHSQRHRHHSDPQDAPTIFPNIDQDHSDKQYETLTFDTPLPTFPAVGPVKALNLKHYSSPFNWPAARKNLCLSFCCASTWCAAYSAGSYSIAAEPLQAQFNIGPTVFQTGLTTWCIGFAISPMVLAPLSELQGRRPVFLASGFMFWIALIGCAVTDSFAGMLVARFFVGAGASTFATMVGGVISDVYHAEKRNTPMALYSAHALAGTGFGPMVSGFIVPRTTWRWVFWHQVIFLGIIMVGMAILFKESRGSVLLVRKVKRINKYLDQVQQHYEAHPEDFPPTNVPVEKSPPAQPQLNTTLTTRYTLPPAMNRPPLRHLIYLSLTTPFTLLLTEPVVFFFSLWAAFAWAVLYLQLNILPLTFSTTHSFTTEQQGATFASLIIGVLLAVTISIYQERLALRYNPQLLSAPEGRLYFACLEAALLPIGLFWFGWTAGSPFIHWIVPCLGIACAMMGIFSIYLAVFNYLADVYHRYASSALACQSFCRNVLAGVFPLFSRQMFGGLGVSVAGSMLGGIAVLLTLVPWVLVFKGEAIRRRSRIASEIMEK